MITGVLLATPLIFNNLMAQNALLLLPDSVEANFDVVDSEIENTGAASCIYNNSTLNVMVWDGPTQGFGWEYAVPSLIYPTTGNHDFYIDEEIHDPDVVIYNGEFPLMYVVYEVDQQIFTEIWKYNNGLWIIYQTPTKISDPSHECSNPNIDRYDDKLAIVWETQGNGIYGATGDFNGNIYSNTEICTEGSAPDVAISFKSDCYISVVLKRNNEMSVCRYNFGQFNSNHLVGTDGGKTGNNTQLGKPRIAANKTFNAPNSKWPYEAVVVGEDDYGRHLVFGLHRRNSITTVTILNEHTYDNNGMVDPRDHETKEPVVSFLEDIKVAWAYKAPNLNGSYEIVKRTLSVYDGTPRKYTPNYYSYSIVNDPEYYGNQVHPCICSRFAKLNEQFIGWYDKLTQLPDFKHRRTNVEIYGAEAKITSDLIYPNPADEDLFITLNDDVSEANVNLYSVDGRHVLSTVIYPDNNKLNISNLNSGIYVLRVNLGQKQKTEKVIIH